MASEVDNEVEIERGSIGTLSVCNSGLSVGSSAAVSRRSSNNVFEDTSNAHINVKSAASKRKGSRKPTPSAQANGRDTDSRARPRKDHEPTPFLGIDMSTKSKKTPTEEVVPDWAVPDDVVINNSESQYVQNQTNENLPPRLVNSRTSQNRMPSRLSQYSNAASEWNALVPRHHKTSSKTADDLQQCLVNTHVKKPFKHSQHATPSKKKRKSRPVSPGADLREQTIMATSSVAKNLARQKLSEDEKKLGRLQKGRLKPLNPVAVRGPTIANCRGIVAERRTTFAAPNRTLERRRQVILDHFQSGFLYERPLSAVESVHQTSVASDVSGNRMQDFQESEGRVEERTEGNEIDEDKLVMNEDYLASGFTFVTDALGDDGELDPDLLEEALASTSQGNMKTKKDRKQSGHPRPQTVQDPIPKAVRFADEENIQETGRRTRSAYPRLSDHRRQKENRILERSTSVPGYEGLTKNRQTPIRIPSEEPHDIREEVVDNANNNNMNGLDPLRLSYNTILFTNEESEVDKHRTGGIFRPRSSHGNWVDAQKPDLNKESLTVVATRESRGELQIVLKSGMIKDAKRQVPLVDQPRKERPQSARTAGKVTYDLNRFQRRPRPLSAHIQSTNQSLNDLDLSIRPDLSRSSVNDLDLVPHDRNTRASVEQWQKKPRPMSGISLAQTPSEISSLELASDDFGVYGNQMQQSVKTAVCTQCHKPSNKIVIHTEDDEVILCDVCDRNNRSKIKQIKKLAFRNGRYDGKLDGTLSDEDLEGDEMVTDDVEELENQLQELESRRKSRNVQEKKQSRRYGGNSNGAEHTHSNSQINEEPPVTNQLQRNRSVGESVSDSVGESVGEYVSESFGKRAGSGKIPQGRASTSQTVVVEVIKQKPKSALKTKSTHSKEVIDVRPSEEGNEDIFSRMEQLEATLSAIQQEIQVQMETVKVQEEEEEEDYEEEEVKEGEEEEKQIQDEEQSLPSDGDHQSSGTDSRNSPTSTSEENHKDSNLVITDNESTTGQFSNLLTHNMDNYDTCNIKVHQYKVQEISTEPKDQNFDENGNISTYEMQMIREHVNSDTIQENRNVSQDECDNQTLAVVATSKPVLQNPRDESFVEEVISPVPPLCFKINAKPPDGHLYYFAYGTDMNVNRFSTYINKTPTQRLWGLLFGFKLRFNKKGIDLEAGGFPNIEYDAGSSVEGCLYLITEEDLSLLDKCVGYPQHFERVMLPVWLLNCSNADDHGVAQYCVPALVYVAQDTWISKEVEKHNSYAVDQCLKGGDLLSESYREFLYEMKQTSERNNP